MGWRHPERCLGIASLCTPHSGRAPAPPLAIFEQRFGPEHYIVRFQDEGLPDRVFGGREDAFFRFVFRPGPPREQWGKLFPGVTHLTDRFEGWEADGARPPVMSDGDLSVYADAYRRTGHRTPTHLYRMIDENWRQTEGRDLTIHCPALMVTAERDVFLPPEMSEGMEERVPDLARATVDAGHWVTWEAPGPVTETLLRWLTERFPA